MGGDEMRRQGPGYLCSGPHVGAEKDHALHRLHLRRLRRLPSALCHGVGAADGVPAGHARSRRGRLQHLGRRVHGAPDGYVLPLLRLFRRGLGYLRHRGQGAGPQRREAEDLPHPASRGRPSGSARASAASRWSSRSRRTCARFPRRRAARPSACSTARAAPSSPQ